MKLFTFYKNDGICLGVEKEGVLFDVEKVQQQSCNEKVQTNVMDIIYGGDEALKKLTTLVDKTDHTDESLHVQEDTISWGPAVTSPSKIICVGLNYKKHADETKSPYPEVPILFNKFSNALTGHRTEITIPKTTKRLDYEVELGIVIGKRGKYIKEEAALDYVFGYCTTNDISARDIQKRTSQWMTGKTNDGFAPVGPYLVPKEYVPNPNNLQLTTTLNGEVRQDSNTADMIFSCEQLISYISSYMTLFPGDLIMTGTPEGVILGLPKEERVYLQDGDELTVEVEMLGALTNTFVSES